MAIAYNPKIATNGLVLCLDAANPKSYPGTGTTWTDLTGKGNNLTLSNGPTYNTSHFSFDGVNDTTSGGKTAAQMNIPDTSLSLIIFMRRASSPTNNSQGQVGFSSSTLSIKNTTYFFADVFSTNNTRYTIRLADESINQTYFENRWAMFAITVDTTTVRTFHDGVLKNTTVMDGNLKTIQSSQFSIADGYGYYFLQGDVSLCMLYNRTLTTQEMQQNFNALRGRYAL